MKILLVCNSVIPAKLYGGIERVVWDLGKELNAMNHTVCFLAQRGSHCNFAQVIYKDSNKPIDEQIPKDTDIVHFHFPVNEKINYPNITTIHGNGVSGEVFDKNSVFVSKNHAMIHHAQAFVYNGLNWDNYAKPDLSKKRNYFHFLGNAAWKVKNLNGAIKICKSAGEKIAVIGGNRINTKMGLKINFSLNAKFYGMVDNNEKSKILNYSKGLIFPVVWEEPFGLAIIESMYYGCPVFGTKYGSLPELVNKKFGFLDNQIKNLTAAIKEHEQYNKKEISDYVIDKFNSKIMAENYLEKYYKVLNGISLNKNKPEKDFSNTKYLLS